MADQPTVEDVAKELMCQCGCGMTLPTCASAMECMVGDQMRDVIAQQIREGRSKGEIINYFVNIYGEKVLAAPTKSGINLTAWIAPFAAIIGGTILTVWLLYTWLRRPREQMETTETPSVVDETQLTLYEQMVDEELQALE